MMTKLEIRIGTKDTSYVTCDCLDPTASRKVRVTCWADRGEVMVAKPEKPKAILVGVFGAGPLFDSMEERRRMRRYGNRRVP